MCYTDAMKSLQLCIVTLLLTVILPAATINNAPSSIEGWVIDSACAYSKNLSKPISPKCAVDCARHGSPLVILTSDGRIYLPIDNATPAQGQNPKLLPYSGKRARVTGQVYERSGSWAIAVQKVEPLPASR